MPVRRLRNDIWSDVESHQRSTLCPQEPPEWTSGMNFSSFLYLYINVLLLLMLFISSLLFFYFALMLLYFPPSFAFPCSTGCSVTFTFTLHGSTDPILFCFVLFYRKWHTLDLQHEYHMHLDVVGLESDLLHMWK